MGREIKALLDEGRLAPDEIAVKVVRQRLSEPDCAGGCVLDGFPRSVAQAEALDDILAELGGGIEVVINLEISDDEVVSRLTQRRMCPTCGTIYNLAYNPPTVDERCDVPSCDEAKLFQRDDDKEEVIRERIKVYHRKTEPLLQYYADKGLLQSVSGEGLSPDALFEKIESILNPPEAAVG